MVFEAPCGLSLFRRLVGDRMWSREKGLPALVLLLGGTHIGMAMDEGTVSLLGTIPLMPPEELRSEKPTGGQTKRPQLLYFCSASSTMGLCNI